MKNGTEREGIWFGLVLLPFFLLLGFLVLDRRMPVVHDTFQFFTLQYIFLNGAATSGEIPRWLPFMMQGTAATWWVPLQGGLLQNTLLLAGHAVRNADFLPLFYGGLATDTALLAVGVWLLSRRFFPSWSAAALVTFTALASAVWTSQIWFNFHMIYAVPLILHFLHRFLESGRWRHLFLSGNLLALQSMGNLPYFLPASTLVIGLYLLFFAARDPSCLRPAAGALRRWPAGLLCLAGVALSFLPVYLFLKSGQDQTVFYSYGRNPDGTVPLRVYLTYGGQLTALKWTELFTGVSALDYSLYIGIPGLFLALRGIFSGNRNTRHFLFAAAAVLALSMATPLAVLAYYAWPMMKYFRHLGLLGPFVKLFLCFLAGAGWEALRKDLVEDHGRIPRAVLFILVPAALSGLLVFLSFDLALPARLLARIFSGTMGEIQMVVYQPHLLWVGLETAAWSAILFALTNALLLRFGRNGKTRSILLASLLLTQAADLSVYRLSDAAEKTHPLQETAIRLTRFEPIPFLTRRTPWKESDGARAAELRRVSLYGAVIGTTPSFIFVDEPGSSFRIDFWSIPIDRFMRAYWKQPLEGSPNSITSGMIPWQKLVFPLEHPAARKIAGISEDKIQFFSRAFLADSDEAVAAAITDPAYAGGFLFLQGPAGTESNVPPWKTGQPLDPDARLPVPYRVDRFDANRIEVSAEIPGADPAWMFYSDVWHPGWRAAVNGRPVPVYRANLAYKAVPLQPGPNRVRLTFREPAMEFLCLLFGLWSLAWLAGLAELLRKICLPRKETASR